MDHTHSQEVIDFKRFLFNFYIDFNRKVSKRKELHTLKHEHYTAAVSAVIQKNPSSFLFLLTILLTKQTRGMTT